MTDLHDENSKQSKNTILNYFCLKVWYWSGDYDFSGISSLGLPHPRGTKRSHDFF